MVMTCDGGEGKINYSAQWIIILCEWCLCLKIDFLWWWWEETKKDGMNDGC